MTTFKDRTGQDWSIELDSPLLKRIKDRCGVLLTDLRVDALELLACDPVLLVDVLYLLCEAEADKRGLNAEQFGKLLNGEAIDQATAALGDAVSGFFPSGKRSSLQSLRQKNRRANEKAAEIAMDSLEDPETVKLMEQHIRASIQRQIATGLASLDSIASPDTSEKLAATSSTETTQ